MIDRRHCLVEIHESLRLPAPAPFPVVLTARPSVSGRTAPVEAVRSLNDILTPAHAADEFPVVDVDVLDAAPDLAPATASPTPVTGADAVIPPPAPSSAVTVSLPVVPRGGDETAWEEVIGWARRLQEGDWERAGRSDQAFLARDMAAARTRFLAQEQDWPHVLARAFSSTSLIDPKAQRQLTAWLETPDGQDVMSRAWGALNADGSASARMERFLSALGDAPPLSAGACLGLGSALLSPMGHIPYYRPTTARTLGKIVDHPVPSNRAPEIERWDAFLSLAAQCADRFRAAGLRMTDAADLFGTMVWVAEGPAWMSKRDRLPGREFSPEEQEAFWDWHRRRMPSRPLPSPPYRRRRQGSS